MKITSIYSFLSENRYLMPIGISVLTIIMLVLTLVPTNVLGDSSIWSYDKLGHLVLFSSWTYILGLYHHLKWKRSTNLWMIFLIGISFGLFIEILQYALPFHRHGDIVDLMFDTLGCLIAVGALQKTISTK